MRGESGTIHLVIPLTLPSPPCNGGEGMTGQSASLSPIIPGGRHRVRSAVPDDVFAGRLKDRDQGPGVGGSGPPHTSRNADRQDRQAWKRIALEPRQFQTARGTPTLFDRPPSTRR